MSVATPSAGAASQGVTKTKRPGSNRLAKLRVHLANIYRLMIKELRSIRSDPIMLALVAYSFTIAIYAVATGASTEATNPFSWNRRRRPFRPVAPDCGRPHSTDIQAGGGDRRDGDRCIDEFGAFYLRH